MNRAPGTWVWALPLVTLLGLVALAFSVGRFPVSPVELTSLLLAKIAGVNDQAPSVIETVIFQIRGPRVLAAVIVGAALAAAGAAYQGMFRNPLVSPDILGVSAGAAVGAVLGIFFSLSVLAIQLLAFAGGLAAVAIVYSIGAAVHGHDPVLVLILAGVIVGTLLGSCIALMKYLADPYDQLAGDHLLAARQSRCRGAERPRSRRTAGHARPRSASSVALAYESAIAA